MLDCGALDLKDDYEFKDEVCYSENKQNEKKKSKLDVSFITQFILRLISIIETIFVCIYLFLNNYFIILF